MRIPLSNGKLRIPLAAFRALKYQTVDIADPFTRAVTGPGIVWDRYLLFEIAEERQLLLAVDLSKRDRRGEEGFESVEGAGGVEVETVDVLGFESRVAIWRIGFGISR